MAQAASIHLQLFQRGTPCFLTPHIALCRTMEYACGMTLGEYIASARTERGWTQAELAKRTNGAISRGYVAMVEAGSIQKPSAKAFLALSDALRVPLSDLHQAAGIRAAAQSPSRRESTRDLLERALLLTPVPLPVYVLESYAREEHRIVADAHPEVFVSPSTTKGHRVEAYLLSGDYPEYSIRAGTVVVVDRDADVRVSDLVAFVTPSGDPSLGVVRRVDNELWIHARIGNWPYRDVRHVSPVIQEVHVRSRVDE